MRAEKEKIPGAGYRPSKNREAEKHSGSCGNRKKPVWRGSTGQGEDGVRRGADPAGVAGHAARSALLRRGGDSAGALQQRTPAASGRRRPPRPASSSPRGLASGPPACERGAGQHRLRGCFLPVPGPGRQPAALRPPAALSPEPGLPLARPRGLRPRAAGAAAAARGPGVCFQGQVRGTPGHPFSRAGFASVPRAAWAAVAARPRAAVNGGRQGAGQTAPPRAARGEPRACRSLSRPGERPRSLEPWTCFFDSETHLAHLRNGTLQ